MGDPTILPRGRSMRISGYDTKKRWKGEGGRTPFKPNFTQSLHPRSTKKARHLTMPTVQVLKPVLTQLQRSMGQPLMNLKAKKRISTCRPRHIGRGRAIDSVDTKQANSQHTSGHNGKRRWFTEHAFPGFGCLKSSTVPAHASSQSERSEIFCSPLI